MDVEGAESAWEDGELWDVEQKGRRDGVEKGFVIDWYSDLSYTYTHLISNFAGSKRELGGWGICWGAGGVLIVGGYVLWRYTNDNAFCNTVERNPREMVSYANRSSAMAKYLN